MSGSGERGILIAVEGIDGAGKTTQVQMLRDALAARGKTPVTSKEPTNGRWGAILRRSASTGRLSLEEELETFIRDRTEHVETLIEPALQAGRTVILDRYYLSTIAYQGARGGDVDDIKSRMRSLFPEPDAVFILDVDPALGVHRIAHGRAEQPNHFEDTGNLAKARAIFQEMKGSRIHHIDGSLPADEVHAAIMRVLADGLLKQN